jgi:hypothetical protein
MLFTVLRNFHILIGITLKGGCVLRFNEHGGDYNQQGFRHHQDYFEPPPFGPPMGGVPMGPPPGISPPIPAWQVGPSGIRNCLYKNTYIWLRNGNSFWFFPTFVGSQVIIGLRWSRRRGWIHHVVNRNDIRSFQCF